MFQSCSGFGIFLDVGKTLIAKSCYAPQRAFQARTCARAHAGSAMLHQVVNLRRPDIAGWGWWPAPRFATSDLRGLVVAQVIREQTILRNDDEIKAFFAADLDEHCPIGIVVPKRRGHFAWRRFSRIRSQAARRKSARRRRNHRRRAMSASSYESAKKQFLVEGLLNEGLSQAMLGFILLFLNLGGISGGTYSA